MTWNTTSQKENSVMMQDSECKETGGHLYTQWQAVSSSATAHSTFHAPPATGELIGLWGVEWMMMSYVLS